MAILKIPVKAKYIYDKNVLIDSEYEYAEVEEKDFAEIMANMIAGAFGVRLEKGPAEV